MPLNTISLAICPLTGGSASLAFNVNLETFLAMRQQREQTVPRFVEREFQSFLDRSRYHRDCEEGRRDERGEPVLP